ncbi:MAG: DUF58 domain-containing protein [Caldicoprobacterales bacterium]|jgi:uncharacterized protein (DUF58 family)|nr:DUF58 domain-containing protein [Clostridiales bacterium]
MAKNLKYIISISFVLLLAGLYTGERIFFIGLGFCVSLLLFSLATALWVVLDFNYTQSIEPRQVTKGSKAILLMEIHNDKFFIYPFIKVYYQTPESWITGSLKESSCSILPGQQHIIREEIDCNIRGRFPIGIKKIEISDLFGFFNFTLDLANQSYYRSLYLDVWPRILYLGSLPIPQIDHEGGLKLNMMSTQEFSNISDIRQYRFGDPLKKIHWKLSSKFQDLLVKNYETDTQPEILFFIETSYSEDKDIINYHIEDQIIECATAVIYYLLSNWISVELITYSGSRQGLTGRNLQDFDRIYGFLARLPFSSSFSITDILKMEQHALRSGTGVFLIVKNLSTQLFNTLFLIKDSNISILLFYIRNPLKSTREDDQIIQELEEKEITTIVVDIDKRLDKILEVFYT